MSSLGTAPRLGWPLGLQPLQYAAEIIVHPNAAQSIGTELHEMNMGGVPGSANGWTAGVVLFIPFYLPEAMTCTRLFWGNGAAVSGLIDVGVYGEDGALKVSTGSTAQAGTSNIQQVDVTDTFLPRGRYYLAIGIDTGGINQRIMQNTGASNVGALQALGMLQQASVTLPLSTGASPATFAALATNTVPMVGAVLHRAPTI